MASEVKVENKELTNAGQQEQHNDGEVSTLPSRACSLSSLNSTKWPLDDPVAMEKRSKQIPHQETKPANNIDKISIGVALTDSDDDEETGKEPEESDRDKLKQKDGIISTLKHAFKEAKEKCEETKKSVVSLCRSKFKGKDEVISNLQRELEKNQEKNEETEKTLAILCLSKFKEKDEVISNLQHEREAYKRKLRETVQDKEDKDEVIAMLKHELEAYKKELRETVQDKEDKDEVIAMLKHELEAYKKELRETVQLPQADEASTSDAAMQTMEVNSPSNVEIQPAVPVVQEIPLNDMVHVQESSRMRVRLTYVPDTAVERRIYNNYKRLMLTISVMLVPSEVEKFKVWASNKYGVDLSSYVYEGFVELDRKGIISASDLTNLREFFEKLLRFDVVHLIDCFLQGDYGYLQRSVSLIKNNNASRNTRIAGPVPGGARNSGSSQGDKGEESFTVGRAEVQNSQNVNRVGLVVTGGVAYNQDGAQNEASGVLSESVGGRRPSQSYSTRRREPQVDMGSNGNKLSKFARPDSSRNRNPSPQDSDSDDDWLRNHRCHNNESNCGEQKAKIVKCVKCGTDQEFSERSQFCGNCHTNFAEEFCVYCKRLTRKKKCSICRRLYIPGLDESIRCPICGENFAHERPQRKRHGKK